MAITNFQFSFYDLGANLQSFPNQNTQVSIDKTKTGPAPSDPQLSLSSQHSFTSCTLHLCVHFLSLVLSDLFFNLSSLSTGSTLHFEVVHSPHLS